MTATTIWSDLQRLRAAAPLVHNITNFVVMNSTANALLATAGHWRMTCCAVSAMMTHE